MFPLGWRTVKTLPDAIAVKFFFDAANAVTDVAYSVASYKQLLPACMIAGVAHLPCIITHVYCY